MSTFETIKVAHDQGVLTITMDRPDVFNAFNDQMSLELATAFKSAAREASVRWPTRSISRQLSATA